MFAFKADWNTYYTFHKDALSVFYVWVHYVLSGYCIGFPKRRLCHPTESLFLDMSLWWICLLQNYRFLLESFPPHVPCPLKPPVIMTKLFTWPPQTLLRPLGHLQASISYSCVERWIPLDGSWKWGWGWASGICHNQYSATVHFADCVKARWSFCM